MAVSGIIGTFLGVRSPGTAYVLLHHYMGEIDGAFRAWGFSKGGTGEVSNAIANAARAHGAEILCDTTVGNVLIKGGKATGVALANGDEISAKNVVSSLDPRRTFRDLVGTDHLPDEIFGADRSLQAPRKLGDRSTSPSTACPNSPVVQAMARTCAATSPSPRVSITSSGPMTTPNTVPTRASHI